MVAGVETELESTKERGGAGNDLLGLTSIGGQLAIGGEERLCGDALYLRLVAHVLAPSLRRVTIV